MWLVCRVEILFRKAKRKSHTVHYLPQYQETRFMKSPNCFTKSWKLFWPIIRRKVTVIGRSESLLDVCGLGWVQTAQPGSAVTARFGFPRLGKVKELNASSKQLVYDAL